jgi:hypothetical protein
MQRRIRRFEGETFFPGIRKKINKNLESLNQNQQNMLGKTLRLI